MTDIPPERLVRSYPFRAYRPGSASVPVVCVTPPDAHFTHTFYDVCPFSPCGRFLAVTRFPYQGRKAVLGDWAEVCVIDLVNESIETVYRTQAWEFQLGANVQWGPAGERALYANTLAGGLAVCVRIDLESREASVFSGPKYDMSRNASFAVGPNLSLINATQEGYGIPGPRGASPPVRGKGDGAGEGIWRTDLTAGKTWLLLSLDQLEGAVSVKRPQAGALGYPFHTRLNRQGTRILQVLRFPDRDGKQRNPCLLTFAADGSNLREVINQQAWSIRGIQGGPTTPTGIRTVSGFYSTWFPLPWGWKISTSAWSAPMIRNWKCSANATWGAVTRPLIRAAGFSLPTPIPKRPGWSKHRVKYPCDCWTWKMMRRSACALFRLTWEDPASPGRHRR